MQFFRNSNIQFMKYRRFFVGLSAALVLLGIFMVFFRGELNLGIDFAGGTQLTLKFKDEPEIDRLRSMVAGTGLGDVIIQRFGDAGSGEVLIKAPTVEGSEEEQERLTEILNRAADEALGKNAES